VLILFNEEILHCTADDLFFTSSLSLH